MNRNGRAVAYYGADESRVEIDILYARARVRVRRRKRDIRSAIALADRLSKRGHRIPSTASFVTRRIYYLVKTYKYTFRVLFIRCLREMIFVQALLKS